MPLNTLLFVSLIKHRFTIKYLVASMEKDQGQIGVDRVLFTNVSNGFCIKWHLLISDFQKFCYQNGPLVIILKKTIKILFRFSLKCVSPFSTNCANEMIPSGEGFVKKKSSTKGRAKKTILLQNCVCCHAHTEKVTVYSTFSSKPGYF